MYYCALKRETPLLPFPRHLLQSPSARNASPFLLDLGHPKSHGPMTDEGEAGGGGVELAISLTNDASGDHFSPSASPDPRTHREDHGRSTILDQILRRPTQRRRGGGGRAGHCDPAALPSSTTSAGTPLVCSEWTAWLALWLEDCFVSTLCPHFPRILVCI